MNSEDASIGTARTNDRQATMRAVRFYGPGLEPRTEELPAPARRPGCALLRVLASGVCHTELQLLDGTLNPGVWPLIPGHEIAGEVLEVWPGDGRSAAVGGPTAGRPRTSVAEPGEAGAGADSGGGGPSGPRASVGEADTRAGADSGGGGGSPATAARAVAKGQRVLVYYSQPCGECAWCRAGQEQVCPNAGPQPGLSADGGYAELVRVPLDCLVPLPEGLDPAAAAPLGCAAATALHALHVADVQAGETVVASCFGGVGLPLIQLARLAGARVLAVGRSAGKLRLAEEMGAEVVDASAENPELAVRRLTGGEGAHTVFELVGGAATMPAALNMARRQGKLVFVGYGPARLSLNPLRLVLRETRILSSLGNTRAELSDVVQLAARGLLRVPLAAEHALEDAAAVLAALRAGEIEGRAVLRPELAASLPAARAVPIEVASAPAVERPHLASPAAVGEERLEEDLLAFVGSGVGDFEELALRLFRYQYARNPVYRALCDRRGAAVDGWRDIPAAPIAAFKEAILACEPIEGAAEFNSSGTTKPERKSRHFHPNLRLYDLNAAANFKAHVLPDRERLPFLVLFPPRQQMPNSSLAHWLSLMVERWGAPGSAWYVDATSGLDAGAVTARLRAAEAKGEAVVLLAASFGLVHFLEHCQEQGLRFHLPAGSRVMDTGGYKGRSREYAKDDLYGMAAELLGVPDSHIVNMYGMTEHGTQFLDTRLRDHLAGIQAPRHKSVPPWARTLVVDPETLREMPRGERGLLLHYDLINRNSVLAVLSEDVGLAVEDGFELLGRAQGAEARGCSIALDELLEAAGTLTPALSQREREL
jgi:D-arabinose 1-dehydrogenase-like Zn-dependent alcohol dehydrogenase